MVCVRALLDGCLDVADRTGPVGFVPRTDVVDMHPGPTASEFAQAFLVISNQGANPPVSEFRTIPGDHYRAFRIVFGHDVTACLCCELEMPP